MILNFKRFSDLAFSKHITTSECCSSCGKKVLHRSQEQENNYNEFVFGMDYKNFIQSFYSEFDYITSLLYEDNKLRSTSFSYIHNKHNDTFLVTYFTPLVYNKNNIELFNANLLTTLEKYKTQQRKQLIHELSYFYLRTQNNINKINDTIERVITCIDHKSYNVAKRKELSKNVHIKKSRIDLANMEKLFDSELSDLINLTSKLRNRPSLLQYKKRVMAFMFDSYYQWLKTNTHQFPRVVCNNCAGKKAVTTKFKEKFEFLDRNNKHNPSEFTIE